MRAESASARAAGVHSAHRSAHHTHVDSHRAASVPSADASAVADVGPSLAPRAFTKCHSSSAASAAASAGEVASYRGGGGAGDAMAARSNNAVLGLRWLVASVRQNSLSSARRQRMRSRERGGIGSRSSSFSSLPTVTEGDESAGGAGERDAPGGGRAKRRAQPGRIVLAVWCDGASLRALRAAGGLASRREGGGKVARGASWRATPAVGELATPTEEALRRARGESAGASGRAADDEASSQRPRRMNGDLVETGPDDDDDDDDAPPPPPPPPPMETNRGWFRFLGWGGGGGGADDDAGDARGEAGRDRDSNRDSTRETETETRGDPPSRRSGSGSSDSDGEAAPIWARRRKWKGGALSTLDVDDAEQTLGAIAWTA